MANSKRLIFRAEGPFVMRRNAPIGGVPFSKGQVVTRDELPPMNDHKLEALFEAYWLDVARPEQVEAAKGTNKPSRAPQAAKKREEEPSGGEGSQDPEGGSDAALTPKATTGAAGDEGASPADTAKPAGYKSFGFGRYWAIDASGEKMGDHMSKAKAEGLAAKDAVPLLGQNEELGG